MKFSLIIIIFFALSITFANQSGIPIVTDNFSRTDLMKNDYYNGNVNSLNSNRFKVYQSYTMGFSADLYGSHSVGVYLNTLSYRFDIPLTLSLDVGVYNLFYSNRASSTWTSPDDINKPEFLLPRVGLYFQPNDFFRVSLQLFNRQDAYRAYGTTSVHGNNSRFWRAFDPTARFLFDEPDYVHGAVE